MKHQSSQIICSPWHLPGASPKKGIRQILKKKIHLKIFFVCVCHGIKEFSLSANKHLEVYKTLLETIIVSSENLLLNLIFGLLAGFACL